MEIEEASKVIGVTEGGIKSQYKKAKERARQMMGGGRMAEQEVCQLCKEAGFTDKLAHYKSHLDHSGKRVPAKCYYHHLEQTPPWIKQQKIAEARQLPAPLEDKSGVAQVPCELKISPDCRQTVAASRKIKICSACWAKRIKDGKERKVLQQKVIQQPDEAQNCVIRRGEIRTVGVSAEFVDRAWKRLPSQIKLRVLETKWASLPAELKVEFAEAGMVEAEKIQEPIIVGQSVAAGGII